MCYASYMNIYLTLPYLTLPYLTLPYLTLPYLTLSCLAYSSLEELCSSCVLLCLSHPAACDFVQGMCFCPTRSSSSAIYPQDRSLPLLKSLFVFVPVLCHCSTDCLCLFFNKSHYKNLPLYLDPLFHLTENVQN